jgi:hypothetical protein
VQVGNKSSAALSKVGTELLEQSRVSYFVGTDVPEFRGCLDCAHGSPAKLGRANFLAEDFATAGWPTSWLRN